MYKLVLYGTGLQNNMGKYRTWCLRPRYVLLACVDGPHDQLACVDGHNDQLACV